MKETLVLTWVKSRLGAVLPLPVVRTALARGSRHGEMARSGPMKMTVTPRSPTPAGFGADGSTAVEWGAA